MRLQYIIQIENQDNYPFDGAKSKLADVKVRSSFKTNKESHQQIYNKVKALLNINSPLVMQVFKVTETKGKKFQVDYEYVE